MSLPEHLHYHARHTWLDRTDDTVTVGLTGHATDGLGAIVYVQLPDLGEQLLIGQPCGTVESNKTASDIDAPASGRVLSVNAALREDPGLLNRDPFGAGWLFRLRLGELGPVLTAQQYAELMLTPFPDEVC